MKSVHWGPWNTEHIADHGVSKEEVEAVLFSPDFESIEAPNSPARYVGEGTYQNRLYRVVYMETQEGIYPISAFKVRKRRIP